jgi:acyl carrier protein
MNRNEIISNLKKLLAGQEQIKIDPESIEEDNKLDQIGFDSISILDFVYDIEAQLGVTIEMADLVKMERVRDLIDYLESRQPA